MVFIMAKKFNNSTSQLSHKDIRVRRKAVRTLFENDKPEDLVSFIPLLDDKDSWFRKKSLDAYRMWAPRMGIDSILELASHKSIDSRRCAANLLEKFDGDTSIVAKILYKDEDELCKLKACKALIKGNQSRQYIDEFLNSEDDKIKAIALSSNFISEKQLFSALDDSSIAVREMSLSKLEKLNKQIDENKLSKLLKDQINSKYLVTFAVKNGKQTLIDIAKSNDSTTRKALIKNLKDECDSSDDDRIKLLIRNKCHTVIGRWLQGRNDSKSDSLRWSIIENEEVDEIERSRLLERLMGRCNEPEIIEKSEQLHDSTNSELLKIIAHNLSTAGNSAQL
jgi:HEAT repeat protein